MPELPRVEVIVLSYNRPHLLRGALAALAVQTFPNVEVTVVDNLSPRSSEVADAVGQHPHVRLIQNAGNLGFTGGMNTGIRQSSGDYLCLTEDDVILEPDFVEVLVGYFAAHPETGLASGVLFHRGARTVLCAGGDYELGPIFRFRFRAEGEADARQFTGPFATPFISGCLVFAKREFISGVLKGFREEFFLYYEDLDLCHRAWKAGRSVVIVPGARAYHVEPPPGPPSDLVEYHKYRNLYSVYFLHAPAPVLPLFVLRYGPWALLKATLRGRFRQVRLMCKAWANVLPRILALLSERPAAPVPTHPPPAAPRSTALQSAAQPGQSTL